jgi:5-oxoprolinase (ATP-hydrolysing)
MPVHLGSMGESVKTIIDRRTGAMKPGDVFVLNAPYNGGTHLPDVTVIAPVFLATGSGDAPKPPPLSPPGSGERDKDRKGPLAPPGTGDEGKGEPGPLAPPGTGDDGDEKGPLSPPGTSAAGEQSTLGPRLRGDDNLVSVAPAEAGAQRLSSQESLDPGTRGDDEMKPDFFVASRGHHADIGGITPGSMPPDSHHVDEEGVLLDNVQLVAEGRFLDDEMRAILASGRYPARNVEQNLADLRAQVAACAKGAEELAKMAAHFTLPVVQAYMKHVQDNAEASVRRVLGALTDGEFALEMDSGAVIRVRISVDRERREATIDFGGTSGQQPTNFNAPSAVCKAAVLYVFRTLVDDEIPMNAGCLKPLSIVIPEGSMLAPRYPAAVVAGNVETSQAITDCLYGALGVLAAAQGTMNNFTFGNERHQYYETISGGSGAGPDFDGTSVVQTHMTNSRLTDPEVLEWRFPVRLDSYAIRRGSGGAGRHRGGDGGERRVRFLEPMTAVMLANRRRVPPFGLAGGAPGAAGRNWVERASGAIEEFGATFKVDMNAGDVFVVQTPGGGGYGASA